ncbi:thiamine phosphate synthase [Roseimaritima sediminicola]|uniref:thiamine phosphate synthase n=1 Tax=Roseimaritima sediminicola TaxID=2662066 RepID=UPI001F23AA24|nr:thiamine phosphate synthase [Roseimaritima sediminicola]
MRTRRPTVILLLALHRLKRNPFSVAAVTTTPPSLPPDDKPAAAGSGSADAAAALRIIDASRNRAAEGLRTLEDYARFVRNDAELSRAFKGLRHDLTAALAPLPRHQLLAARDTEGDVGTTIQTTAELSRVSTAAVAHAAAARCQQALRSIEEYLKCVHPAAGPSVEAIRYRTYTLEAALETPVLETPETPATPDVVRRTLAAARLYVLIDGGDSDEQLQQRIAALIRGGVDIFQLRDKRLDDRRLYERALAAVHAVRTHSTAASPARREDAAPRPLLIVNDRADIAVAAGADGVHVGQDELPLAAVRRIVGRDRLIGVSTHRVGEAEQAQRDGADYIGCGPTFPSRTKSFTAFAGLAFLREVANRVSLPAFAIGGIDAGNVQDVQAAGFERIAVAGAVTAAAAPEQAARELKQRLCNS